MREYDFIVVIVVIVDVATAGVVVRCNGFWLA